MRLLQFFESKKDAASRKENDEEKITMGLKRKHDHIDNISAYTWNADGWLKEVSEYDDGHQINYSQLAKKYNMKNKSNEYPPNGGQIVKEYLIDNGIDVSKFEPAVKRSTRIRRALRRYILL